MKRRPIRPEDSYRYERKYHCDDRALQEVELMVRMHPAGFRVEHPPRAVNNVYLDSPDLRRFAMHVHGAADRRKLRVRWYGAREGHVEQPVLEIKIKRGNVGTKARFELAPFDFSDRLDDATLRREVRDGVCGDPGLAEAIDTSLPAIFNRYQRQYYRSGDGRFRLTVDTELGFRAVPGHGWGPLRAFEEHGLAIIELKYDVADDDRADGIARHLPFRISKYSKCVYGLERLGGLVG